MRVLVTLLQALWFCSSIFSGVKEKRKFLVFVNPHGGPGKARSIYAKKVAPVLQAAECGLEVIYTTHRNHAFEVVKEISLDYDAIIVLSGDGLIHEVLNGLASHKNPMQALRIPVSPVPTGSGNGMCLNLHGLKDGFDVVFATMCAIKGRPMNIDLFSFVQGDKRLFSFMSQCIGLMADLDLGTEHLRWMGDTRFAVGFLRGALSGKFPFEVSYKLAEDDKVKMAEVFQQKKSSISSTGSQYITEEVKLDEEQLPPLKHLTKESISKSDEWIVLDKPALFLFAGQGPYVSRYL
jgi:sphingosine kinase